MTVTGGGHPLGGDMSPSVQAVGFNGVAPNVTPRVGRDDGVVGWG